MAKKRKKRRKSRKKSTPSKPKLSMKEQEKLAQKALRGG